MMRRTEIRDFLVSFTVNYFHQFHQFQIIKLCLALSGGCVGLAKTPQ